MPNGKAVTNLRVATSESWKDSRPASSASRRMALDRHGDKLAEISAEYLRKGRRSTSRASSARAEWQDKEGRDRYTTEIQANEMHDARQPWGRTRRYGRCRHGVRGEPRSAATERKPAPAGDTGGEFGDDIPF
jgi:single-strand DNA-binding protein